MFTNIKSKLLVLGCLSIIIYPTFPGHERLIRSKTSTLPYSKISQEKVVDRKSLNDSSSVNFPKKIFYIGQQNYCETNFVSRVVYRRAYDRTIHHVYYDYRRGRERIEGSACGREYWITPNPNHPDYGIRFVYLVNGQGERISETLYYESVDGNVHLFRNRAEARVPDPFASDLGITSRRRSSRRRPSRRRPSSNQNRSPQPPQPVDTQTGEMTNQEFINRVIELTNIERSKQGLPPLTFNRELSTAAQNHTTSMAINDFFSHTGLDGSSMGSRIVAQGYQYTYAAENIAVGSSTPEGVVAQWMNSPGHRANILNRNLSEIGVGYYFLENDTGNVNYNHYWTQVFASPGN